LDESYPGGLPAYLTKSKVLLAQSALGSNPFNDFVAHVPEGESLSYYDTNDDDTTCTTSTNNNNNKSNNSNNDRMTFAQAEQIGLSGISNIAFVLVAGGLGERLGYSGIKLGLSTNILTETCYLEVYCQYILALQRLATTTNTQQQQHVPIKIPLVIMTSDDTDPLTRKLLIENNNFGLDTSQIQIIKQDKVAALINSDASLSMVSKYVIETKPHGHGDVHHLLYKCGIVDTWYNSGTVKHVIFLQDTNALVINSVIPTLGVSIARGYHMNSICIPRLAGEAAGAIARLEHKTDPTNKSLVINVEYNQLGPLLSSQGDKRGDVPDPTTGYSLYPGNANNIIIELSSYHKTLHGVDQGVVDEFVNPKYKDETVRTEFKKPTRLECMMQDYPKLLQKEVGSSNMKIGFTLFDRWFTFSPAKVSNVVCVFFVFWFAVLSSIYSTMYI
jgi:UDP-sugar pyrophosphorylase